MNERQKLLKAMSEAAKKGVSRGTMIELIENVYHGHFMHLTWSNRIRNPEYRHGHR